MREAHLAQGTNANPQVHTPRSAPTRFFFISESIYPKAVNGSLGVKADAPGYYTFSMKADADG